MRTLQQAAKSGAENTATSGDDSSWSKYSVRHKLRRITAFPQGVTPPKKVRLYRRRDHFLLQWWDKREKRTLNERVDGDLVAAIFRAREIDERLVFYQSSGHKAVKIGHTETVDTYLEDLEKRADAGEIDVATVQRYASALNHHYRKFVSQPDVDRSHPHVCQIDRDFQLQFAAYLSNVQVSPNGHPKASLRPLKDDRYVMDVVRAMLAWAADPERGDLLPEGFRNPFTQRSRATRRVAADAIRELVITTPMAADLIHASDEFQLAVFAPLVLFGLRPGEVGWLCREHVTQDWVRVPSNLDLGYLTKGRRDKRFPMMDCLASLWQTSAGTNGLLYHRRNLAEVQSDVPFSNATLAELEQEFQKRLRDAGKVSAAVKRRIRNQLLKEAGQLTYDHMYREFCKLRRKLSWPPQATMKEVRHLFATNLENAGVPEFFRRYFMGHSFGRAPIATYTHITPEKLREQFQKLVDAELQPLIDAIKQRRDQLIIERTQP